MVGKGVEGRNAQRSEEKGEHGDDHFDQATDLINDNRNGEQKEEETNVKEEEKAPDIKKQQEAYAQWYAQYWQAWQNYYQANGLGSNGEDYQQFMQTHGGVASQLPAPGSLYEARRSQNMLNHYIDPTTQTPSATSSSAGKAMAKRKPTKEELEFWRRRKEENKKIKNRWLYQ